MNHAGKLAALVAAVAVVGGLGVAAGRTIRSPADAEAARRPPPASPVTARVQRKVLSATLTARGTIRYQDPTALTLAGPVGSGDAAPGGTQVITEIAERGAELGDGSVVLTVSGRPVFLVQGTQPMYRSITPGVTGTDVAQLEAALARWGIDPGPLDGVADGTLQAAVTAWYQRAGYQPQAPTIPEQERKRSLEAAVQGADREVASARSALQSASAAPTAVEYLQADVAVANARDALASAQRAAAAPATDGTRTTGGSAGSTEPGGAGAADAAAAQDQVRQAERALSVAQAQRDALDAARPVDAQRQALDAAQRAADAARAELERFNATSGISVPAGEVVFVASLPLRVDEVKAKVGDILSGAPLTLSGTRLAVDASVAAADRDLIRHGASVEVDLIDADVRTAGTIDVIDAKAGTRGLDASRVYVSVRLDDAALAGELAGGAVRITVPVASTGGEVLAIPLSALVTRADGTAVVEVDRGGTTDTVTVRPGLAAAGDVEVTPIAGALAPGDRVVVGRADQGGTGATVGSAVPDPGARS